MAENTSIFLSCRLSQARIVLSYTPGNSNASFILRSNMIPKSKKADLSF